jgi:hypothetical protein
MKVGEIAAENSSREPRMAGYIARFMKNVLGENGHETEICQRSISAAGSSSGQAIPDLV